jgi:organic radical activating enzyme
MQRLDKFVLYNQDIAEDTLYINLFTIRDCNIRCWYCIESIGVTGDMVSKELFDKVIKFIDIQNRKYILFHFYGGEPTINENFIYFIKKLKDIYKDRIYIRFTTNLMKSKSFFQSVPYYANAVATFHVDWVTKPDEWFDKALMLYNNNQLVGANIMIQQKHMEYALSLYNKYKAKLPILKLDPIDQIKFTYKYLQFRENHKYDEHNVFGWFNKEDVDIVIDGKKKDVIPDCYTFGLFKGMICTAGFDIYENGDVKWCDGEKKVLTNLHKDKIIKYPRFHLCKNDECPGDTEFGKYSIQYFLKYKKGEIECLK